MLANDLYRINKNSTTVITKNISPIKKIFVTDSDIVVEDDLFEPVFSTDKSVALLQNWFSMLLNNTSYDVMGLADITVQSSQRSPYVRIYGYLEKTRLKQDQYTYKIILSIGKDKNISRAVYDIGTDKLTFDDESDVPIKINKDDYFDEKHQNLYDLYLSHKILTDKSVLTNNTFKKIVKKFINFIRSRPLPELGAVVNKKTAFSLYILPTKDKIAKKTVQDNMGPVFDDAFGNNATHYPDTTTQTAKFLSYDDEAFTINCTNKESFYENLGIGNNSLTKIELPTNNIMRIGIFEWIFLKIQDFAKTFEKQNKGFLYQVYSNYKSLDADASIEKRSIMKIICLARNQNKIEIMIDENLTMQRQEEIFANLRHDIPYNAFEIMIPKSKSKKTIWREYITVIRAFITNTKIKKQYFVDFFSSCIKNEIHEWFDKNSSDPKYFFSRSEFLIRFLCEHDTADMMDENENYAHNIGQMSRYYIEYRRKTKTTNNSLLEILKYSKYDQNSLRNVLTKISAGIAHSNSNNDHNHDMEGLEKQIQSIIPTNEIEDDKQSKDYAYFFYKGYFTGGLKLDKD